MHIKLLTISASALTLLMASSALAADNNTLYLEQFGEGNSGSVHQSSGNGGNDIGMESDPVTQEGDNNQFLYSNAGYGWGSNNDIVKAEQLGDDNVISVSNSNGSNDNVVFNVQQIGNLNQARIGMNGSDSGTIGAVLLDGNNNHLVITQSGATGHGDDNNDINQVTILGDNNGLAPDSNGAAKRAGVYIKQAGSDNLVQSSSVEGDNNTGPAGDSNTYRNVHRIEQTGTGNGTAASTASTIGSDGNRIWVFQNGSDNNFNLSQGIDTSSTGNDTTLEQTGSFNYAVGTQAGDNNTTTIDQNGVANYVDVSQAQDGNTATVDMLGDFNGTGTFTGDAATLALSQALGSGQIIQDGLTNSASLAITGNLNRFAFLQDGDSNGIDATQTGDSNQAVVVQAGNGNISSFTQLGGNNILAVSQ